MNTKLRFKRQRKKILGRGSRIPGCATQGQTFEELPRFNSSSFAKTL